MDSVNVDVQFGVHEAAENDDVVPEGKPSTKKERGSIGPPSAVAVTVVDWNCPCVTTTSGSAKEKSNTGLSAKTVTAAEAA